jgi:hypothetical protein
MLATRPSSLLSLCCPLPASTDPADSLKPEFVDSPWTPEPSASPHAHNSSASDVPPSPTSPTGLPELWLESPPSPRLPKRTQERINERNAPHRASCPGNRWIKSRENAISSSNGDGSAPLSSPSFAAFPCARSSPHKRRSSSATRKCCAALSETCIFANTRASSAMAPSLHSPVARSVLYLGKVRG